MLDVKYILENLDQVRERTRARKSDFDFDEFERLAGRRRDTIHAFESARAAQNVKSSEMKQHKPGSDEFKAVLAECRELAGRVKELEEERRTAEVALEELLLTLPNEISARTPIGEGEEDNPEISRSGEPTTFSFAVRDHVDLGTSLKILDMEAAARVSGARFAFLRGAGARLERALSTLMLDLHTGQHGYEELSTPYLVHAPSLVGTGQLPKFEEDLFRAGSHYLIPTAEVPITNFHRETILESLDRPLKYCALTPCFRSEAGSHGRDVRGLIRMHQFLKVELVNFCRPEDSEAQHEILVGEASRVLELLEIPHRVIELCSADIGFAAARCFDIEVWLPSQDRWVEISSCSNFGNFQARRAEIRYRAESGKPAHVHTLNGSGVAVGRAMLALMENHQRADGSIGIPAALQPYFGADVISAESPIEDPG